MRSNNKLKVKKSNAQLRGWQATDVQARMTQTMTEPPQIKNAADVGGTFTDLVATGLRSGAIAFKVGPLNPTELRTGTHRGIGSAVGRRAEA